MHIAQNLLKNDRVLSKLTQLLQMAYQKQYGITHFSICLITILVVGACTSPARMAESPASFSVPAETEPTVESAKSSEIPLKSDSTPTAPQLTATLASISETSSTAPVPLSSIKPLITSDGLRLRFDSWAPDSLWIAYWLGESEESPASLTFANFDSGETCQHDDVKAQDLGSGRVIWQEDGSATAILNREGEALGGVPCKTFAPVENVTLPDPYTREDLSPDGRYLAERIILEVEEQGFFHSELRITEIGTGRQIFSVPYIDSPHFIFGGPRWLSNELFLIGKTVDQGVLYYSVRDDRVGNLFPDILGLEARDEENVSVIQTQATPGTGEYHLLLEKWVDTPGSLLYHRELNQIEDLSSYRGASFTDASGGWSSFSPDGRWLLLLSDSSGGEDPDTWLRPVDPPGSPPVQIADQASPGGLSSNRQLMAFFRRGDIQILSFPDGRLLSRWAAPNYDLDRLWWSPDGNHLIAYGSPLESSQEALFVIEP